MLGQKFVIGLLVCLLSVGVATAATKSSSKDSGKNGGGVSYKAATPYLGAILVNANTGEVLFEDHADQPGYPASVLKLMDLLIILEKIDRGSVKLDEIVQVTAEAAKIGGSQVYLKENEEFTVEELLYALMIQSANDAARALSIHISGSKDGFVELMNKKAKALGMKSTHFNSDNGLPPSKDQQPDITTARDLATMAIALLKNTNTLNYTSVKNRKFRNDTFEMKNHNKLLWSFKGCDGLKTGYFKKAGFSIIVTAERNGTRVVAVVLGSEDRKVRDRKAAELLSKGLANAGKVAEEDAEPSDGEESEKGE